MKISLSIETETGDDLRVLDKIIGVLKSDAPALPLAVTVALPTAGGVGEAAESAPATAAATGRCRYCGKEVTGMKKICDAPECRKQQRLEYNQRYQDKKKLVAQATFDQVEDDRRPFGLGIKR